MAKRRRFSAAFKRQVVELKASAPHRASSKVQQLLEERYGIRLSRRRSAAPQA